MADEKDKAPPAQAPKAKVSWLDKIAPGVRKMVSRHTGFAGSLWLKDPNSGEMVYRPDLEQNLWVTPSGSHMRIGPAERFAYTFDGGAFERLPAPETPDDPLQFTDDKPYRERLAAARKANGERDAVSIGAGEIHRTPAVVMVQDFAFLGGSLSMGAGEAFIAADRAALDRDVPLVAFTASGGARK